MANNSLFSLILQANWLSHLILIILFLMSIISWAIICWKWRLFSQSLRQSKKFIGLFYDSPENFAKIKEDLEPYENFKSSYYLKQYEAAYSEKWKPSIDHKIWLSRLTRSIQKTADDYTNYIEKGLPFLASVSSAAPFIGLLGTVMGIIDSFHNIGIKGVTSLAVVAPGISEALIATAFGLFAAIPALLGYNYFRNIIRSIRNEMSVFQTDLINHFEQSIIEQSN